MPQNEKCTNDGYGPGQGSEISARSAKGFRPVGSIPSGPSTLLPNYFRGTLPRVDVRYNIEKPRSRRTSDSFLSEFSEEREPTCNREMSAKARAMFTGGARAAVSSTRNAMRIFSSRTTLGGVTEYLHLVIVEELAWSTWVRVRSTFPDVRHVVEGDHGELENVAVLELLDLGPLVSPSHV
ncbi:hypothetical protein BGW80DRAFT_1249863 [Lactifluus volemus]|nr:hypothetical protein BGW80DRAFT_1249863 [Lactifluus volemus]